MMKKRFSIIGDSISTLLGCNPDGYAVFYDSAMCFAANISSLDDTYWGRVINHFGGELLVNNSYSGSQVAKVVGTSTLFPSACSVERTSGLHKDDQLPEIVMVFIGTNDWGRGGPLREDEASEPLASFSGAYRKMISDIHRSYPSAQIWCFSLLPAEKEAPCFEFPSIINGHSMEDFNNVIREIVKEHECVFIDLYRYHQPYDSIDGGHPSRKGMKTIAELVIREIEEKEWV